MNELQLSIILQNIGEMLRLAMIEADKNLPKDIERIAEAHYIGKSISPCLDQNNWEKRNTGYPISFSCLLDLKKHIDKQVSTLR